MSEHAGPEWYFFRVTSALPGEETEVSLVGTGVSLGAGAPTPHRHLRLPPSPRTGAHGPELCLRKTLCAICNRTHAPFQALVSDIIGKFQ